MIFKVVDNKCFINSTVELQGYLLKDNWDDWFQYNTLFHLYLTINQRIHEIGEVKIGQFKMKQEQRSPEILSEFNELSSMFFSVGQDTTYYENLTLLGAEIRDEVLKNLQDIAKNEQLFLKARKESVTKTSLLRAISERTVKEQFRRLANGGLKLSNYKFEFIPENNKNKNNILEFNVVPESNPPTNINVIIGRNGVGKTRLLNKMISSLLGPKNIANGFFQSQNTHITLAQQNLFANLVFVSFSAFDMFDQIPKDKNKGRYSYIGLKKYINNDVENYICSKNTEELAEEFSESIRLCTKGAKKVLWENSLHILESDPVFKDANILSIVEDQNKADYIFRKLSSGHKIVLLTITKLVETVEEASLVLLDEPESHLHPPLLSAFIRALSDLLINRNGVCIIATHSPVILQEVPKECVWIVRRNGTIVNYERPGIETFGENVGTLTREVFGLEVTLSGFHNLLKNTIEEDDYCDYENILSKFDGKLGFEAKAIIKTLLALKEQ